MGLCPSGPFAVRWGGYRRKGYTDIFARALARAVRIGWVREGCERDSASFGDVELVNEIVVDESAVF